jgi:glycosyltransferase involved in cell wall biosynthesis
MHAVLNAQLVSTAQNYRGAGVSNYSRHLLQALGRLTQGTTDQVTALISDAHVQAVGLHLQRTPVIVQQPLVRIAWEQVLLPVQLARLRADLVHGLVNVLPLATHLPSVVTVHDLSFLRVPETLPAAKRFYLARLCQASVTKARRVIAVSRQTADDLMALLGVPARKLEVIHNGVSDAFRPGDEATSADFRRQRDLPERFILSLGTLEPRKNLEVLLRAYARWRHTSDEAAGVGLVLAGGKGWFFDEIFRQVQRLGLTQQVRLPGFVPEAELPDWYRAAELFVYPSRLEGFGLPVLEALACGTPVACSRVGSLLEIVGDSALTFPPDSEDALVACLQLALTQPALRAELQARGLAQAQQFTWERAARETLAVYRAIAA